MIPVAASWIVMDIEGTTSPTSVVQESLFRYARERIRAFVDAHGADPPVAALLDAVRGMADLPLTCPDVEVAGVLEAWIDEDRKAGPLKTIQGMLWHDGFAAGELAGSFFADVPAAVRAWHQRGLHLAVFSSGSVQAQRDWFAHGPDADLGALIREHFDTVNAGPKREPASYARITHALQARPQDILFLSDVAAELDAAAAAGWQTMGIVRAGEPHATTWLGPHPAVGSFSDLSVVPAALGRLGRGLADATRELAGLGLMPATSGNVSVVAGHEPWHLLVTASGLDKRDLTWADCVLVDEHAVPVITARPGLHPSAETALHIHVARREAAGAVVHVHALSSVRAARRWPTQIRLGPGELLKAMGLPADAEMVVPVVPNSQSMVELGERWEEACARLGHALVAPAFVVAEHGLYTWADDLVSARRAAEALDWLFTLALDTE